MCGSTQRQNDINDQQTAFMGQLMDQYKTTYGQNEQILGELTKSLAPIVKAGPGQQGFGKNELAALNTQATQGSAQAYKQAATATDQAMAARGGGNSFIPSGAQGQIDSQMRISAENNLGNEKLGIVKANYDTGRANYFGAEGALAGAMGAAENPLAGQAGAVNNSSGEAASEANAIQKANDSWMGLVGGLASSAIGAFSPLGMMGGAKGPSFSQAQDLPNNGSGVFDQSAYTLPNL